MALLAAGLFQPTQEIRMRRSIQLFAAGLSLSVVALAAQAASLESAARSLGASQIDSVEFSGSGRWFQFGQAAAPGLAWPQFDVSRYVASFHYGSSSARVQINRLQTVDPDRVRPTPAEQKVDAYVSGDKTWNVGVAPAPSNVTPQPAAVEERQAEIWATPQGFVKAALANGAKSRPVKGGVEVSFTVAGRYRWEGFINEQDRVERVRTWIDNPVLGDTLVETSFDAYRDVAGLPFPSHIVRTQGGFRVLDVTVSEVKFNVSSAIQAPATVPAQAVAPTVTVDKLAEGVYFLTGGTHHSVLIEQRDHLVLVEAPQNEARSEALIAKVKETVPGKPIKYLVNSHAHFDHSGGLRTFADLGATIVTHKGNVAYYKSAWSAARKINPDRLARSGKQARFATFTGKHVLTDGKRRIEIYPIFDNTHNDAFAMVYLPAEKILIEGDAYTPLAANAKPPATPNPYAVNLLENIEKLKLDVAQIAALHGPGIVKLGDLQAYNGRSTVAGN
jgi:glyoxylase-like metal-dependent hydrolase (beta-lactamase superfamily II)